MLRKLGMIGALLVGLLALVACAPVAPGTQANSKATAPAAPATAPASAGKASPVPTPEAAAEASTLPPAAVAAQMALAEQLGVAAQDVSVVSVEATNWPDSCLGAEQPGQMCAAVITPGYRVVLSAGGQTYEVHTNESGSNYRIVQ